MKSSIKDIEISIKSDYLEILNNAKKNEKERSLVFLYPEIAKEWHKEKNHQLSPWNFTPSSNERVWWTCNTCSRDWGAIINKRVNGQTCPYCSGYKAGPIRSLEKERPQTAAMWHPTKNGDLTPKDVLPGSNKMAWWFCSTCNQEWEEPVSRRSSKKGCPYCNGKRVYEGNCLATIKQEIAELWHPTKNGKLTPFDVTSCSGKLVWWKCRCGNEYEKQVCKMKEKCNKCRYKI